MRHSIHCALNAINCAYENIYDDETQLIETRIAKMNDTQYVYDVALSYIENDSINCVCVYEHSTMIENELRELYRFAHLINFECKMIYVQTFDLYHLIYTLTYDDNEKTTTSMIVRFNDDKSTMKSFETFELINDIEIWLHCMINDK